MPLGLASCITLGKSLNLPEFFKKICKMDLTMVSL